MERENLQPPFSTILIPLRNGFFRTTWIASQIASLGWLVQTVTVSWLMATISDSDVMVAIVQGTSTLPAFVLSIPAGAIVDSFSRHRVMLAGRCLVALTSFALVIAVACGFINPWLILGLTFVGGCGFALIGPAWNASIGDILQRRDVPAAVMLMSIGYNIVRSAGPALGGVVLALSGPLAAFGLAALSYLVPLMTLMRSKWHIPSSPLPRERIVTAVYDGVRFTTMSSVIRVAIVRATIFGFASIPILALLPIVVRDQIASGPIAYGILLASFGMGAFAAGMANGFLRRIMPLDRLIASASALCAACCLLVAFTSSMAVAVAALAIGGAGGLITWTAIDVCVQLASPRWVVGRTLSIYYAVSNGGVAAGSWVWGTVAQHYSVTWALAGAAVSLLLVAAAGIVLPISQQSESDQPTGDFTPPEVALEVKPRSGPIVVRTDYTINDEDIDAFLGCMRERRYNLSRAGARGWTLQRNLQSPSLWTETFRTPTWTDFLRLNHRLPVADRAAGERLLQLHDKEHPPYTTFSVERTTEATRRPFVSRPPK